jgi:hypothetical protein
MRANQEAIMTTRFFVAGVLGGIAMFIWTSVAHMAVPLGKIGVSRNPNDPPILDALKTNLGEKTGLYIFPGMGLGTDATSDQEREAMNRAPEAYATNPSGLLMYHAPGRKVSLGGLLGVEFGAELAESLLAVFLLAQTGLAGFAGRAGFVTVAGILAAISTNISYWNWYGFP